MSETTGKMSQRSGMPSPRQRLCAECQTGVWVFQRLTYFTWLNDELITVPNFPAWVCDVCGKREYDSQAVVWLNTLLHPDAGTKNTPKGKLRRKRANRSQLDSPPTSDLDTV